MQEAVGALLPPVQIEEITDQGTLGEATVQGTASSDEREEPADQPVQRVQPEERLDVRSVQMDATDHRFCWTQSKGVAGSD